MGKLPLTPVIRIDEDKRVNCYACITGCSVKYPKLLLFPHALPSGVSLTKPDKVITMLIPTITRYCQ